MDLLFTHGFWFGLFILFCLGFVLVSSVAYYVLECSKLYIETRNKNYQDYVDRKTDDLHK